MLSSGSDRDLRRTLWPVPILARAEVVTKLTAICPVSGKPATRTQRIINGQPAAYDDPIVLIDAEESYEPRSRNKHVVIKKK